jgi:Domain of unknown function (DUF397)
MTQGSFEMDAPTSAARSSLRWIKSTFSAANGNCVEIAALPDAGVAIRDSKDISGPTLRFTADEWNAFLGGVRNGDFDRMI